MKNLLITFLVSLSFSTFVYSQTIECDRLELWYYGKMISSEEVQDFVTVDIPSGYIRFNIDGQVFYEKIVCGENPFDIEHGRICFFKNKIVLKLEDNTFVFKIKEIY